MGGLGWKAPRKVQEMLLDIDGLPHWECGERVQMDISHPDTHICDFIAIKKFMPTSYKQNRKQSKTATRLK